MNGNAKWIGFVVGALAIVFSLIGASPWASKREVEEMKGGILRELVELRNDVREIRRLLGGAQGWQ